MFRRLLHKIRKWLIKEEYFAGVDYGYKDSSCVIIVKHNLRTGKLTVISDRYYKDAPLGRIERIARQIAKEYSAQIVSDYPRPHSFF